jgi:hypothetical protein
MALGIGANTAVLNAGDAAFAPSGIVHSIHRLHSARPRCGQCR